MNRIYTCVCLALVLTLAGCGRSTPLAPDDILSIRILPKDPRLYLEQSVQLVIEGHRVDGSVVDLTNEPELIFRLNQAGIINVLSGAKVQALQAGTVRLMAAFGGREDTVTVTVLYALLEGIEVSPGLIQMDAGDYVQLAVTGDLSDGSTLDLTDSATGTVYATADQNVATVTTEGLIFAQKNGQTGITATHGEYQATATVTVGELETLEVLPVQAGLEVNETVQLQVFGTYKDGSVEGLTGHADTSYTSSDPAVTSVDPHGLATGVSGGEATITAGHRDQSAVAYITVTGTSELIGIEVTPCPARISLGGWVQLSVWADYSDGSRLEVTPTAGYTVSDEQVATVDTQGLLTAAGAGEATVTASYGSFEDTCRVTVEDRILVSIDLLPDAAGLFVGETLPLSVMGTFNDGSQDDLTGSFTGTTYASTAPTVVTVSPDGVLTALSSGEAVIEAANSGLTDSSAVNVIGPDLISIEVEPDRLQMSSGDSANLVVWANYSDGSRVDVTTQAAYDSSNPLVADVQAGGLITALSKGATVITATYQTLTDTCDVNVEQQNPQPTLGTIAPDQVPAGSADTSVTLNGTGFISTSTARLDSMDLTTTFVSATQLTAVVPAAEIVSVGAHEVAVYNPPSGGGLSNTLWFFAVETPAVTTLSPDSGLQGTMVRVIFYGNGLLGCGVSPDNPGIGVSAVAYSDDGIQLSATFVIGSAAPTGIGTVTLINLTGSTTVEFTVIEYQPLDDLIVESGEVVYLQGVQPYHDIIIGTGATVYGTGTVPLQFLATGDVTVRGEIHVSGHSGEDGYYDPAGGGAGGPGGSGGGGGADGDAAGGAAGGDGSPPGEDAAAGQGAGTPSGAGGGWGAGSGIFSGCGQAGGGGGFGGDGGSGGGDAGVGSGGPGGLANTDGSDYNGGTGGGGGSCCGQNSGGGGGGGGGVLVISAISSGTIVIDGALFTDGGNGGDGFLGTGGGGGGSGGRITITTEGGTIAVNDTISVHGGSGGRSDNGDAGGGGGGGRIIIDAGSGTVDDTFGYYDIRGGPAGTPRDTGFAGLPGSPGLADVRP